MRTAAAVVALAGAGLTMAYRTEVLRLIAAASERASDALVELVLGTKAAREVARKRAARKASLAAGNGDADPSSVEGLPHGNHLAKKWIVMDLGARPPPTWIDPWRASGGMWRLKLSGDVEAERLVRLKNIAQLGVRDFSLDWHCVTGWSARGVCLRGVSLKTFIDDVCRPSPDWRFLLQRSADGYTTVVAREDCEDPSAFVALGFGSRSGEDTSGVLPREHGGVRLVFPRLFGWKSAKFLAELHFLREYRPGFWEALGCHPRGRWEHGERWAPGAAGVWNVLAWLTDQYRVVLGYAAWVFVMQKGGAALGALVAALGLDRCAAVPDPAPGSRPSGGHDGGAPRRRRAAAELPALPAGYQLEVWAPGMSEADKDAAVRGAAGKVLLVGETAHYRAAAAALARPGDVVFEIGCDRGVATELLAERVTPSGCVRLPAGPGGARTPPALTLARGRRRVVAADVAAQSVAATRARLAGAPQAAVHELDCLADVEGLARLGAA